MLHGTRRRVERRWCAFGPKSRRSVESKPVGQNICASVQKDGCAMLRCGRRPSLTEPRITLRNNTLKVLDGKSVIRLSVQDILTLKRGWQSADDGIVREAYTEDMLAVDNTGHLPRSIYCPISRLPMKDSSCAPMGTRTSVRRWSCGSNERRSPPTTGEELAHVFLTPNHALRGHDCGNHRGGASAELARAP